MIPSGPSINAARYWYHAPKVDITGTVMGFETNQISVWFDSPPENDKKWRYSLKKDAELEILSCLSETFVDGKLQSQDNAWFQYTWASPSGALLQLSQDGRQHYRAMTYTDSLAAGTFYEEIYSNTNLIEPGYLLHTVLRTAPMYLQ